MARFNLQSATIKIENYAGGEAYRQSPELELISILLTSFAGNKFYRSFGSTFKRLQDLINETDKIFVAKALVYARTKFGMRSISHVGASELAKHIRGEKWAKDFYAAVISRPDDMTEILSFHTTHNGKIPNSMKKGLAKAFDKFSTYELAKYRSENKRFKLIDVVNLVHPTPTEFNKDAIEALIKNKLKSVDTWESELTKAGQAASNEEQKAELKKKAWINLIREKKLGYFALLRNLRNIIEQAPEIADEALEMLTNKTLIKNSLVLPFRFLTAYQEIEKIYEGKIIHNAMNALNKAAEISVSHVPKFEGETLIALDVSGSMRENSEENKSPHLIGSFFSAVLVKANQADFMIFDNVARYINIDDQNSILSIAKSIPFMGGGTNFHSIFERANKKYDRIIILSDMQAWMGYNTPTQSYNFYKSVTGADPFIYSFDLSGYGSLQFPENNICCISGFSEKIFESMPFLEMDKKALVNEIKKVSF